MMKVYNQEKTQEISNYDLTKGYLVADKIFKEHHDAVEAKDAVYDRVLIKEYPSGGKEYKTVLVTPAVEPKEAWDEYEDIQVYILYTEEELQAQYENAVNALIREKYTLSQELAILRQKDTKPEEYTAYNEYCEQCKTSARLKILGSI